MEVVIVGMPRTRLDALMLGFIAYMAERSPRPLSRESRYNYRLRVQRAIGLAQEGGYSLLAGDERAVRYVLLKTSPHPSTRNGMLAALLMFYEYLLHQGLRRDNPAKAFGRSPKLKSVPRPLPFDQCVAYLEAARDLGPFHRAIATLGLYMGLRISEIRFRKWADFFAADGETYCDVLGKGARLARVAVHEEISAALVELRAAHSDATWLFPSPSLPGLDRPVSINWIRLRHAEILAEAGLPHATPHQLRHSHATYLGASGADFAVVQQALRHADPKSTAIYRDVLPGELARALRGLSFRTSPA